MIIRLPVHTAEWSILGDGAFALLVEVQALAPGSKSPPESTKAVCGLYPPQTTIRLPVQTAVARRRASGTPEREVGDQLLVAGSKIPPEASPEVAVEPPQTTILVPVHTAT
jgi:hypothetical protein